MTVRCLSSALMSGLLTWRNPQGAEVNWMHGPQGIADYQTHRIKVIVTGVGIALLTVTATLESVAYAALSVSALALYPFTSKPFNYSVKLLESSSFTILWGIADLCVYNPCFVNVMTHESFARTWAEMLNPTPFVLLRLDDKLYLADWEVQVRGQAVDNAMLAPLVAMGRDTQKVIEEGASFIVKKVLHDADGGTISLFKTMDPGIFHPIVIKALEICLKNNEVPLFFKEETRQFLSNPQLTELKAVALKETYNGIFVLKCWIKAIEILDNDLKND